MLMIIDEFRHCWISMSVWYIQLPTIFLDVIMPNMVSMPRVTNQKLMSPFTPRSRPWWCDPFSLLLKTVDEILGLYHLNETSLEDLLHRTIHFPRCYNKIFWNYTFDHYMALRAAPHLSKRRLTVGVTSLLKQILLAGFPS